MDTFSDSELVHQFRNGDNAAFTELYERYADRIYRFVYYKTHHRQTAEDLVSQTFLQALENIVRYKESKGAFSAWLHRIARNLVIDHYRSYKELKNIDDVWDLDDPSVHIEQDTDTVVKMNNIRKIMKSISADQREILLLRLWHGYKFQEIAEITGKSEAACKMQYKRTLGSVKKEALLALFLLLYLSHHVAS